MHNKSNHNLILNNCSIVRILFVFFALFIAGCASSGSNFRNDALSELQPGSTTETEAITLLGSEPTQIINEANGTRLLLWSHVTVAFGSVESKAVSILFDSNRIMLGFNRGVNVDLPVTKPKGRHLGIYVTTQLPNGNYFPTISTLHAGGLSEAAGWLPGDTIIAVDDMPVTTLTDVVTATKKGGKVKQYTLKRGEDTFTSEIEFPL